MKVPFDQLPNEAKVWMYQAARPLDESDLRLIEQFSDVFLDQWESHGIPVQGSVDVLQNRFIRVSAYTNEPSMCGRAQDAQVRLVKELEGELNVALTDRMLLIIEVDGDLAAHHFTKVEDVISAGELAPETPFFNPLVASKEDFQQNWKVAAKDSWLSRYF